MAIIWPKLEMCGERITMAKSITLDLEKQNIGHGYTKKTKIGDYPTPPATQYRSPFSYYHPYFIHYPPFYCPQLCVVIKLIDLSLAKLSRAQSNFLRVHLRVTCLKPLLNHCSRCRKFAKYPLFRNPKSIIHKTTNMKWRLRAQIHHSRTPRIIYLQMPWKIKTIP